MGNTQSQNTQSLHQCLADFTEIRKENNGIVMMEKKSNVTYFLKEFNFVNKKEFENQFKRLKHMQSEPQNQNILSLLRLFSQTFNNICSTSYRIYALYEYPQITLDEQIAARKKQNKYFQECELWSILQSCANALSQLKPALSLHPRNIYIVPDGILKVINNEMIDEEYRCYVKQNVYYAPEKIQQFKRSDNEDIVRKESIFSLGMTLLHAALLQPIHNCYNYQNHEFSREMLQKNIELLVNIKNLNASQTEEANRMYSEQFIETLAMILEPCPNKRVSLMEVHGMLNKIWNSETEQSAKEEDQLENLNQSIHQSHQQSSALKQQSQYKNLHQSQALVDHLESIEPRIKNVETIQQSLVSKNATFSENSSFLPSFHPSGRTSKAYFHEQTRQTSCHNKTTTGYPALNSISENFTNITNNFYPNTYVPEHKPYSVGQPYLNCASSTSNLIDNPHKQNNLYTDPKLLEMIRKDLRDLNQLKKSTMRSVYGDYPSTYTNNQIYNYSSNRENSHQQIYSLKSSYGDLKNMFQNYAKPTQNIVPPQRNQNIMPIQAKQESSKVQEMRPPQQAFKKEPGFSKNNVVFVVQQYEDGRKFEGTVVNGIKDGHGKLTYADGAYYQGNFKNDKMQGEGTLFYGPGRPAYEGNWLADQFHGYGILYNQNPFELNGCFNYNDFNLIEDFWIRYQGHFDCDNKSGEGKLTLSNGQEFHGNFVNDFINGKGVFITQEGQEVSGIWEDNILVQLDA